MDPNYLNAHIYFSDLEILLHDLMHKYFIDEADYLMFGVLLCEWSSSNLSRIIKSGFPPALTIQWQ